MDFHVSPSQLDTALSCMRRWAWDKIAGLPRGENKYAARGSAVHGILENWLLKAQPPDLSTLYGKIAYSALSFLPAPMTTGLEVEQACEREFDGVAWSYRKDWRLPFDGGVIVGDHKTCSNPDKYGHFPIGVLDLTVQPVTYAYDELSNGAPGVRLYWTDMTTAKPFRTVPQILDVVTDWTYHSPPEGPGAAAISAQSIKNRFQVWNNFGRELIKLRKKGPHPLKLPYNANHCQAYGTECPYRQHCNLTKQEELISLMSETTMPNDANAFLAVVAAMSNKAAAVSAMPAPTMAPPAPGSPAGVPQFPPPQGFPVQNAGFTPPTPEQVAATAPAGFQYPPPAVPVHQAPVQQAPVQTSPFPAVAQAVAQASAPKGPVQVFTQPSHDQNVAAAQSITVEAPKKGRGRPRKADQVPEILNPVQLETDVSVPVCVHPPTIPAPAPNPDRTFRQDLVLAMAANAGYCALDSVALATRLAVLESLIDLD